MAPRKYPKLKPPIPPDGGYQLTAQYLGLSSPLDIKPDDIMATEPSLDVVFVSIDLEVSRYEKGKPGAPLVKEFGIAILDTRLLRSSSPLYKASSIAPETGAIVTKQFSTSHSSQDFILCDATDFKECVFAETVFVAQEDLATTVKDCLRIRDTKFSDKTVWRNVVVNPRSMICRSFNG